MSEWEQCRVPGCGNRAIHKHHIFGKANRKFSEKYKLWIRCCKEHHDRFHKDMEFALYYKQMAQRKFEKIYGHEKFMEVFGENWIGRDDENDRQA